MKVKSPRCFWIPALALMVGAACGEERQNVRIIIPEARATFVQGVDTIAFRAELGSHRSHQPNGVGIAVDQQSRPGVSRQ